MIRDRLKKAARKVALKAFGMERDAEDRRPTASNLKPGETKDIEAYMPKIVDGSGDTPGPNHKHLIGRTWLSAQVISHEECVIDLRPPEEYAQGHITHARLLPGDQLRQRTDLLPDKAVRVTVYDADDGGGARAMAEWLRAEGWGMARALQGGWAEWLEHGEPSETPAPLGGRNIGDPVELVDGRRGVVQAGRNEGGSWRFDVLLDAESGAFEPGVPAEQLER
jgi:rhodanese-related sulfurtransferase